MRYISNFIPMSIHLASLYSQIFPIRNAIVFLKLMLELNSHSTKLAIPYSPTHWFFFLRLEHLGNSSSPARCCRSLRWTSLLQSILMVCLSQEFLNSQGKFQIGISRFRTLSSSQLVSVRAIFTTTVLSSYSILTACKSRRKF